MHHPPASQARALHFLAPPLRRSGQHALLSALLLGALLMLHITACTSVVDASAAAADQGAAAEERLRHALFFSFAFVGHLRPLLAQAHALSLRPGWTVSIASTSDGAVMVEQLLAEEGWTGVQWIDLGQCRSETWLAAVELAKLVSTQRSTSWIAGLLTLNDVMSRAHTCVYRPLQRALAALPTPPAVVVSDYVSAQAAEDVLAQYPGVAHVLNNADLLPMLSPEMLRPAADWLPVLGAGYRLAPTVWHSLPLRALWPVLRVLGKCLIRVSVEPRFNEYRAVSGLAPVAFESRYDHRVVLVNNAFPLEYNRHLSTQVHLVGPQLHVEPVHAARQRYIARLHQSERQWMEAPLQGSGLMPVIVYVSMGTIVPLSAAQVNAFLSAFLQLIARHRHVRVLWKLRSEHAGFVNASRFIPSSLSSVSGQLLVSPRVSSQLAVLSHPRTLLFLSHCGINSAYESVYLHVPVLCYPIAADQADMSMRVADSGAGDWLNSKAFDELERGLDMALVDRIERMLDLTNDTSTSRWPTLQRRVRVVGDMVRLSGGAQRAVDLIEAVATHGERDFLSVNHHYPLWAKVELDELVVWALLLCLLVVLPVTLSLRAATACRERCRRLTPKVHTA